MTEKERADLEAARDYDSTTLNVLNYVFEKLSEQMYSQMDVEELLSVQRGNCYVAVLGKCNDEELASAAIHAPEPGGDRWKKNEA